MDNQYANRDSDSGPLGRLLESGDTFFRPRARDFLMSQPNAVEAARRLGCTCADFSRLLTAWGMKGASMGSMKRHLAEMGRSGTFDENEVLRLTASAWKARNKNMPRLVEPIMPDPTEPRETTAKERPRKSSTGWSPRTHLTDIRPS